MKKQLILALLGLAVAGGANAAVTTSATGSGNLFFTAYDDNGTADKADDRAYVRNLSSLLSGGSLTDWTSGNTTTSPAPTLSADKQAFGTIYSVAADTNFSSFLSGNIATSNVQWNIAALDSNGTDRLLITSNGISAAQTPGYLNFRSFASQGDIYLAQVNPAMGANSSVLLNGASANISLWGNNVGGKSSFNTAAGLGGSLNMYLLSEKVASGSNLTLATVQQYTADGVEAMTWNLSANGLLTYGAAPVTAPVPEPETYAMLLAGLGLMAGISRRRLGKK